MSLRSKILLLYNSIPTQHYPRITKKIGKKKAQLQKEAELYSAILGATQYSYYCLAEIVAQKVQK